MIIFFFFFFQAEDGIRDGTVTGVQTCALPICSTAPTVYVREGCDVVGCTVGAVERDRMISGEAIRPGDVVVGVASDGLHTNGYSLARAALLPAGKVAARLALDRNPAGLSESLGRALLRPHRPYARAVLALGRHIELRGIAHVTGGVVPGTLVRLVPARRRRA